MCPVTDNTHEQTGWVWSQAPSVRDSWRHRPNNPSWSRSRRSAKRHKDTHVFFTHMDDCCWCFTVLACWYTLHSLFVCDRSNWMNCYFCSDALSSVIKLIHYTLYDCRLFFTQKPAHCKSQSYGTYASLGLHAVSAVNEKLVQHLETTGDIWNDPKPTAVKIIMCPFNHFSQSAGQGETLVCLKTWMGLVPPYHHFSSCLSLLLILSK